MFKTTFNPIKVLIFVLLFVVFSTFSHAFAADIAVTYEGYDDFGAVLERLGFEYDVINEDQLKSIDLLSQYKSLFINCSAGIEYYVDDATVSALQQYVSSGGVVYASDYSAPLIDKAFPGKIIFYDDPTTGNEQYYDYGDGYDYVYYEYKIGEMGDYKANVVDSGLAAVLGKNVIDVTYDLGSWVVMTGVGSGTQVHITGSAKVVENWEDKIVSNIPYVVSFSEGEGEVIYTSFHNEAQVTEDMEKVLDWFAVRTSGGKLVQGNRNLVAQKPGYEVVSELVDTLNNGETKTFTIDATGNSNFDVVLNYFDGKVSLVIENPSGEESAHVKVDTPPYSHQVDAVKGTYKISVIGSNIPEDNSPLVLTLAGPAGAIEQVAAGGTFQGSGGMLGKIITALALAAVGFGAYRFVKAKKKNKLINKPFKRK